MIQENKFLNLAIHCLIVVIVICIPSKLLLAKGMSTEANITERGRTELILHALTEAVNNPNYYNLDIISSVIPAQDKETAIPKIRHFFDTKSNFESQFEFTVKQSVEFDIGEILQTESGLQSTIDIIFQANNIYAKITTPISFNTQNDLEIISISDILDNINTFIDNSWLNMTNQLTSDGAPTPKPPSRYSLKSDNLFNSKDIYNSGGTTVHRFTTTASNSLFGHQIFGRPYDVIAVDIYDPPFTNDGYLIFTDPNWNRIIGGINNNKWLLDGEYGQGTNQFNYPCGIAFLPPDYFFIADGYNNRVMVYDGLNDNNFMVPIYQDSIANSFNFVQDVATAHFPGERDEIAILDKGNCKVDIYSMNSAGSISFEKTLFSEGSGNNELLGPKAVCFGKSYITGYHEHYIYVADNGNSRVVMKSTTSSSYFEETNYEFPENAVLSSVNVDNFGYVYVVDKYNSVVYLFSHGLQTLIASYGSEGDGDKEILYPDILELAEKWHWDTDLGKWEPVFIGDAALTEYYYDNTGIRRYLLGFNVLNQEATFTSRPFELGYDLLEFKWHQSGPTESWSYLYYQNTSNLIHSEYDDMDLAGFPSYRYFHSGALLDTGWYIFRVNIGSIFPGSNDTTLWDSVYISQTYCGYDTLQWQQIYTGKEGYDIEEIYDQNGKYILLSDGGISIQLRMLNPCGGEWWTKDYGVSGGQCYGRSVDLTSDGGYIIAGGVYSSSRFSNQVYVIKTNSSGDTLWTGRYGNSYSALGHSIEQTQDGGYIITGSIAHPSVLYVDLLLMKLDSSGDSVWAKVYGDPEIMVQERGLEVRQTSDLGYIIAGHKWPNSPFILKTNALGDTTWSYTSSSLGYIQSVDLTTDGGYVFTGSKSSKLQIAKLNSSGGLEWEKVIDSSRTIIGYSVKETIDGGFIISGDYWGEADYFAFMAKTNACGDSIWTKTFRLGDTTQAIANAVIQTSDEGFLLTGRTRVIGMDEDVLAVKVEPQPTQLDFVCGDADGGQSVNILDVVYIVNYKYKGGPPPVPLQSADANSDCHIDILDVTYIVNYKYKGGPALFCPD